MVPLRAQLRMVSTPHHESLPPDRYPWVCQTHSHAGGPHAMSWPFLSLQAPFPRTHFEEPKMCVWNQSRHPAAPMLLPLNQLVHASWSHSGAHRRTRVTVSRIHAHTAERDIHSPETTQELPTGLTPSKNWDAAQDPLAGSGTLGLHSCPPCRRVA